MHISNILPTFVKKLGKQENSAACFSYDLFSSQSKNKQLFENICLFSVFPNCNLATGKLLPKVANRSQMHCYWVGWKASQVNKRYTLLISFCAVCKSPDHGFPHFSLPIKVQTEPSEGLFLRFSQKLNLRYWYIGMRWILSETPRNFCRLLEFRRDDLDSVSKTEGHLRVSLSILFWFFGGNGTIW